MRDPAAEVCGAADFGLQMALRRGGLHMLGPIWVVMNTAATIGEALNAGAQNLPFRMTAITARVADEGDTWATQLDIQSSEVGGIQALEFGLGIIVLQLRKWLGSGWRPLKTQFRHAAPDDRSAYGAIFGHAVQFDQVRNAIVLDRASWTAPLPTTDPRTHRTLTAALRQERPFGGDDLARRVSQQLRVSLLHGRATLTETARDLGVPPRTLQHRLHEAGMTYQEVLDSVRVDLGVRYLRTSRLTAAQISEVLQFSDCSAFSRFVKRQTGRTPREIRGELPTAAHTEGLQGVGQQAGVPCTQGLRARGSARVRKLSGTR